MEKLFIVRHGDYDGGGLSGLGQSQIVVLAEKLKCLVNGGTVRVLSSPAVRATQSAKIISDALGSKLEEHRELYSPPFDYDGVEKLIAAFSNTCHSLVLVAHLECAQYLPWHFGSRVLGATLESSKIKKGEALVIDCFNKSLQMV